MKCPKCNEEIVDLAKFCTKCGANIEEVKKELEEAKRKAEEETKLEEQKREEEAKKEVLEKEVVKEVKKKEKSSDKVKNNKKSEKKEDENKEEKKIEVVSEVKEEDKKEEPIKVEKTKKKKKHIFLKLILILILLVILVFAGSYGLYRLDVLPDSVKDVLLPVYEVIDGWFGIEKDDDKDDNKDKENEVANEIQDEKEKIKYADEDEDLVYDAYNKTIAGNIYRVPAINLDYDNIEDINREILNLVEKELKEIEKVTELPEGAISRTDYKWYQNKNILSLVFYVQGYHVDSYYTYNVDVYTGEEIDNEDILATEKIDKDDFSEKCSEAVEDYFENYLYSKEIAESAGSVYDDAKSKSIKESNFSLSKTQMFLGSDGTVYIVAKITTIAGAGHNEFIINIEKFNKNSKDIFADNTATKNNTVNTTNTTNTMNVTNTTNTTNTVN